MDENNPQVTNTDKYFKEQMEKIIPPQKPVDQRSFFQRRKRLIIFISLTLLILFIAVNIYINWGLNYAYQTIYNIK